MAQLSSSVLEEISSQTSRWPRPVSRIATVPRAKPNRPDLSFLFCRRVSASFSNVRGSCECCGALYRNPGGHLLPDSCLPLLGTRDSVGMLHPRASGIASGRLTIVQALCLVAGTMSGAVRSVILQHFAKGGTLPPGPQSSCHARVHLICLLSLEGATQTLGTSP